MSTHRASNLGNLFNARRAADHPAQAPEATPYSVPVSYTHLTLPTNREV